MTVYKLPPLREMLFYLKELNSRVPELNLINTKYIHHPLLIARDKDGHKVEAKGNSGLPLLTFTIALMQKSQLQLTSNSPSFSKPKLWYTHSVITPKQRKIIAVAFLCRIPFHKINKHSVKGHTAEKSGLSAVSIESLYIPKPKCQLKIPKEINYLCSDYIRGLFTRQLN